jgi:hypothetical protein
MLGFVQHSRISSVTALQRARPAVRRQQLKVQNAQVFVFWLSRPFYRRADKRMHDRAQCAGSSPMSHMKMPDEPSNDAPQSEQSRLEEMRRMIEEYADDLRKIIRKYRRKRLS